MKDKVLILNGGYSEIPLIESAKREGYTVLVTGNNTKAPGNSIADEYIRGDYSKHEEMLSIAKRCGISCVCSSCNDKAYGSKMYICDMLGIDNCDSFETIERLHDKRRFRELQIELGLKFPFFIRCDSVDALELVPDDSYPVIIKPTDMDGGRCMVKCDNFNELSKVVKALLKEHKDSSFIVEEFLTGTNHGFTSLIRNQRVEFFMTDNEYHVYYDYAVSAVSVPSMIDEDVEKDLVNQVEMISKELNLRDGLVHVQFMLTDKGPYILEVCRRSPGDLYIEFVKYATGIDYPRAILTSEVGEMKIVSIDTPKEGCLARQVIVCEKKGMIRGIQFSDELEECITERYIYYDKDKVLDGSMYKCGVLFLKSDSQMKMKNLLDNIKNHITFDMKEE